MNVFDRIYVHVHISYPMFMFTFLFRFVVADGKLNFDST